MAVVNSMSSFFGAARTERQLPRAEPSRMSVPSGLEPACSGMEIGAQGRRRAGSTGPRHRTPPPAGNRGHRPLPPRWSPLASPPWPRPSPRPPRTHQRTEPTPLLCRVDRIAPLPVSGQQDASGRQPGQLLRKKHVGALTIHDGLSAAGAHSRMHRGSPASWAQGRHERSEGGEPVVHLPRITSDTSSMRK